MKIFLKKLQLLQGNRARIKVVILFSTGLYLLLMTTLGYAWYSRQWAASPFHFFNDAAEWKQMDKFGHFFWTFQVCALATRLFSWAHVTEKPAALFGVLPGFLFVSLVEIPDGFSQDYGASLFDILANAAGGAAFLLQNILWKKIKIWPKFSFHPTSFAPLRPEVLGNGFLEEVLKDYNGQTYWYSASFKILPLPQWLTLAVGVGAEGMIYGRDHSNELAHLSPHRKYFLSLDLNLSHLRTSSKILNSAIYLVNIIKIPAPTLEISGQGIRFHPLYF